MTLEMLSTICFFLSGAAAGMATVLALIGNTEEK